MNTTTACVICGSTRSHRSPLPTGQMVCDANMNGRNRCREREVADMIREACRCDANTVCLAHAGYTDQVTTA